MKLEVLILMSQLLLMGCGVTRTDDENEASLGSQQFTLEELSYDPDPPAGLSEEQIAAAICAHYPQKSFSNADYMQIHRSASKVLPNALAIELQFPETDHFITHYGMNDDSTIWNTEAFFSGRYILTMQVPIVVNYKLKTFSVKEGAVSRFFLREAAVCRRDGHTTYNIEGQRTFDPDQFDKLVASGWDWKTVGVELLDDPITYFRVKTCMARAPRVPISLAE